MNHIKWQVGWEKYGFIPIGRARGNEGRADRSSGGGANRSGKSLLTAEDNFFEPPTETLASRKSSYFISAKATPSIFSFTRSAASDLSTCTSFCAHFLTRGGFQSRAAAKKRALRTYMRCNGIEIEENTIVCKRCMRYCRINSRFLPLRLAFR